MAVARMHQTWVGHSFAAERVPEQSTAARWPTAPAIAADRLPGVLLQAVEAARHSITIADLRQPDAPLVYGNPSFFLLTGYPPEEVVGRNCRFLQGPGTDMAVVATIRRALTRGEDVTATLLNYRLDGRTFWNELHLTHIRDDDGAPSHVVATQLDVSDRIAGPAPGSTAVGPDDAVLDRTTGLPVVHEALARIDALVRQPDCQVVVVLVELLGQDDVGLAFGAPNRSRVAAATADRLRALADPGDLVAMADVDSFVVVRRTAAGHAAETAAELLAGVRAALRPVLHTSTVSLRIPFRSGTARMPHDGASAAALLAAARRAAG